MILIQFPYARNECYPIHFSHLILKNAVIAIDYVFQKVNKKKWKLYSFIQPLVAILLLIPEFPFQTPNQTAARNGIHFCFMTILVQTFTHQCGG